MAVEACQIARCENVATGTITTLYDFPERSDEVHQVKLHACDGHREQFKGAKGRRLALDAANNVVERPDRKPADWCRICKDSCKVGAPGDAGAHKAAA